MESQNLLKVNNEPEMIEPLDSFLNLKAIKNEFVGELELRKRLFGYFD